MKGAFETFLVLIFGLSFFMLSMSLFYLNYNFQQARLFQESIINIIEQQNRYDDSLLDLINHNHCPQCSFKVETNGSRYLVRVNFPVKIPILNIRKIMTLSGYTYEIKQIE